MHNDSQEDEEALWSRKGMERARVSRSPRRNKEEDVACGQSDA
jgi:hypothetical protein